MSQMEQIRRNAEGNWASARRRGACVILLGALGFVTAVCGGSDDGAAPVAASSSEPTAVATVERESVSEAADGAQDASDGAADEAVDAEAADHDDDDSDAGDHDAGDDSDAEDRADGNDDGDDSDARDQDDDSDASDHADDAHGSEQAGEVITAASDGTPEIATAAEQGTVVPEGTYVLNVLGEDWRLRIDEPMLLGGSDADFFHFTTGPLAESNTLLALMSTVGIMPPREVGVHQGHDPLIPASTVEIPDDLTSWFDAVPQVTVVDSGSATVAGKAARWFRLTVDPAAGPTFHCPFSDHCAGFVVTPMWVTVLAQEIDVMMWELDALPDVMAWVQVEDPANTQAAQQAMVELLDGLSAA